MLNRCAGRLGKSAAGVHWTGRVDARLLATAVSKPTDKLLDAASKTVKEILEAEDGIEANKRRRETEPLQRALLEVQQGEEVRPAPIFHCR